MVQNKAKASKNTIVQAKTKQATVGRKPVVATTVSKTDTGADANKRVELATLLKCPKQRRAAYGRLNTAMHSTPDVKDGFHKLAEHMKLDWLIDWMLDPSFAKCREASTTMSKSETLNRTNKWNVLTRFKLESIEGKQGAADLIAGKDCTTLQEGTDEHGRKGWWYLDEQTMHTKEDKKTQDVKVTMALEADEACEVMQAMNDHVIVQGSLSKLKKGPDITGKQV